MLQKIYNMSTKIVLNFLACAKSRFAVIQRKMSKSYIYYKINMFFPSFMLERVNIYTLTTL